MPFWKPFSNDNDYQGAVDDSGPNHGKRVKHETSAEMRERRTKERPQALNDKNWHENGGEQSFYRGMAAGYSDSERYEMAKAAEWEQARLARSTANNHVHKIRNGYVSFSYDLWRFWKDMGVDLYEVFYPGLFGKGAGEEKFRRAYQKAWDEYGCDPAEEGKCDFTYETEATKDWNIDNHGLLGTSHTTVDDPNYSRIARDFLSTRSDMSKREIIREAGRRWHPDALPEDRRGQSTELLQEISHQLSKRD